MKIYLYIKYLPYFLSDQILKRILSHKIRKRLNIFDGEFV